MVQRMETDQGTSQKEQATVEAQGELMSTEAPVGQTDQLVPIPRGASTPIPIEGEGGPI